MWLLPRPLTACRVIHRRGLRSLAQVERSSPRLWVTRSHVEAPEGRSKPFPPGRGKGERYARPYKPQEAPRTLHPMFPPWGGMLAPPSRGIGGGSSPLPHRGDSLSRFGWVGERCRVLPLRSGVPVSVVPWRDEGGGGAKDGRFQLGNGVSKTRHLILILYLTTRR